MKKNLQPEKPKEDNLKFGVIYVKPKKELKEKEINQQQNPLTTTTKSSSKIQIKENEISNEVIEKGIENMTINNSDEDAFKVDNYQPNVYLCIFII